VSRRRLDDATVTISVGELRAIVRAEIDDALARARTKPARPPKSRPEDAWTPAQAAFDAKLRVRR
jgi:hypothetical protein